MLKLMKERGLEFNKNDYKLMLNRLKVNGDRRLRASDIVDNIFEKTHPNYYNVKDYV